MLKDSFWTVEEKLIFGTEKTKFTFSSPSSELLKKLTSIGELCIIPDLELKGLQMKLKLKNGYGLSIIKNTVSYGHADDKWEIGVIKEDHLNYDTDITSDVLGFLNDEQVAEVAELANKMDENGKLPEGITIDSIYENEE